MKLHIAAFCLVSLYGLQPAMIAETVISDSFSEANRPPGKKIAGSMVETENASWEGAHTPVQTQQGGNGVSVPDGTGFVQKIKIPEPNATRFRLEASIRLQENATVAIGLGDPSPENATWLGGLYVAFFDNGSYSVLFHPVPADWSGAADNNNKDPLTTLKAGAISGFNREVPCKLVIEYDKPSNSLTVQIDDQVILEQFDLNSRNIVPSTEFAGFSGWGQPPDMTFLESFSLKFE